MLVSLEGPPLKSLLCEMGGATDAGQPRGTTPEVFCLLFRGTFGELNKEKQRLAGTFASFER